MAKILVVDDSSSFREKYASTLSKAGYVVEEAFDGREALDKMLAGPPDLVYLALDMPVMSVEEVLEEINKTESLKHIPVVLLVSFSDNFRSENMRFSGSLAGHLIKDSATPDDILTITQAVLGTAKPTPATDAPKEPDHEPRILGEPTEPPSEPAQLFEDQPAGAPRPAPSEITDEPIDEDDETPYNPTSMGQPL